MANTKSAKKRTRKTIRQTLVNKNIKNRVRTFIKKVEEAMLKDKDTAKAALVTAESEMMKGVSKGVVNKNNASRKISRLFAKIKTLA
ncbi:MAG: 30S ribosomal protein S20 [Alphaproteobacteria bacterium ADurb.Bin438]|nr:MAG: 30S ribosomal protein S20 [Alphaproteobacteria bacterium ADurb.Bin438]